MKPLFQHWPLIEKRLRSSRHCVFLFDVDGTLAPIRAHPGKVRLTDSILRALRVFAHHSGCSAGLVSGRSLQELHRLAPIPGLLYIGNHGFEIQRGHHIRIHPLARATARQLSRLAKDITRRLVDVPGAWVENKKYTLAIHFRQTPADRRADVEKIVQNVVRACTHPRNLFLKKGKMLLDVRPTLHWNKGSAVAQLRRAEPRKACVFYIGDDSTDEDVFRVLSRSDLSICIGNPARSAAQFSLPNQRAVRELLRKLIRIVTTNPRRTE